VMSLWCPPARRGQPTELACRCTPGRLHRHLNATGDIACARHPGHELLGAITREHKMRVAVDETRDHATAPRVEPLVGRRPRRLHGGDTPIRQHERRVVPDPERTVAQRRIAGHEQPDVVDRQRAHGGTAVRASSSSLATSSDS
jgi:hypothetical protein